MKKVLEFLKWIKKTLAAASAALIVTGEVFADGELEGAWLPPSGEVLLLIAAWLGVFGVWKLKNRARA